MATGPYPSNWKHIKEKVKQRDDYRCVECESQNNLHVHHMRPLRLGGNNELYNLITLCAKCHGAWHIGIKENGLDAIWGPGQEPHWEYLTDYEAVKAMIKRRTDQGYDMSKLHARNEARR